MADTGGISDYASLANTSREAHAGTLTGSPDSNAGGFQAAGAKLGDMLTGGGASNLQGQTAYNTGLRVGAQTINALAEARQRVSDSVQGEKAANQLEDPQFQAQIGLPPAIMSYAATLARMGGGPEKTTAFIKEMQQEQFRAKLGDATAPLADRHAAAVALSPESAAPKAEGPLGSTFDPLANSGSGATSVSPLQRQVAGSEIAQHQGAAAASNANANQKNGQGLFGKPPTGMRYVMKPDGNGDPTDTSNYTLDNTGRPALEAIPGYNQAKGESGTSARFHENELGAAEQAGREVENVIGLKGGIMSSSGVAGVSGGHGLTGQLSQNIGRFVSDTNQQEYARSIKNFGRAMSMLENGGSLRASGQGAAGSYQEQFENLPSDSPDTRVYGVALMRQGIEAQNDKIQASNASATQKAEMQKITDQVTKAIPFSPRDVSGRDTSEPIQAWLDKKYGATGGGSANSKPNAGLPAGLKVVN